MCVLTCYSLHSITFCLTHIQVEAKLVWIHMKKLTVLSGERLLPININVELIKSFCTQ